jgi:hypothetical protein
VFDHADLSLHFFDAAIACVCFPPLNLGLLEQALDCLQELLLLKALLPDVSLQRQIVLANLTAHSLLYFVQLVAEARDEAINLVSESLRLVLELLQQIVSVLVLLGHPLELPGD